jgi:hypothetical protein
VSAGRLAVVALLAFAVIAGAGLFYLEQFHWYDLREAGQGTIALAGPDGAPVTIAVRDLAVAEGDASPLKYRACFATDATPESLAGRVAAYAEPEPTIAPLSFPCFDAGEIAAALDAGRATAYRAAEEVTYGIDRVVALTADGRGYAWHQLNVCGERVYDGDPPPPGCPPPPATSP